MLSTLDNFRISAPCKLCQLEKDTISHVLNCIFIKLEVPDILNNLDINVNDAFKSSMEKMKILATVFKKLGGKERN